VKWENGEKEREGDERRKAGRGVVMRARFSSFCSAKLMWLEEGERCQLSCKP